MHPQSGKACTKLGIVLCHGDFYRELSRPEKDCEWAINLGYSKPLRIWSHLWSIYPSYPE